MRFASLFTGGGGADVGAREAGLLPVWGLEYVPEIAAHAESQLGHPVICADILVVNPADFEAVDFLHASPPCPSFSVANAKSGGETENDISLARKVAEFIEVLRPRVFTLENVRGYRKSQSWKIIAAALDRVYGAFNWDTKVLDAADCGVPQNRIRMWVRASLDRLPPWPVPVPHAGWYEAIADLLDGLPDGELAPWQIKRLGAANLDNFMLTPSAQNIQPRYGAEPAITVTANGGANIRAALVPAGNPSSPERFLRSGDEPSQTLRASRADMPKAIIVGQGSRSDPKNGQEPAQTITANRNQRNIRAVLVGQQVSGMLVEGVSKGQRPPTLRDGENPSFTIEAGGGGRTHRAVLYPSGNSSSNVMRDGNEPAAAIHSSRVEFPRVIQEQRIVMLDTRCLARLQTFPDWYELPVKKSLAVTIIGNAVPPLQYEKIIRPFLESQ